MKKFSFENIKFQTDHRLIAIELKIKIPCKKITNEQSLLIKHSPKIYQENLAQEIRKHKNKDLTSIVISQYNALESAIKNAVLKENQSGNKTTSKRSKKLTEETIQLIEKHKELNRKMNKSAQNKIEHCKLRKLTKKKIREDIEEYENGLITKILESTGSTKRLTKEISQVKSAGYQN